MTDDASCVVYCDDFFFCAGPDFVKSSWSDSLAGALCKIKNRLPFVAEKSYSFHSATCQFLVAMTPGNLMAETARQGPAERCVAAMVFEWMRNRLSAAFDQQRRF